MLQQLNKASTLANAEVNSSHKHWYVLQFGKKTSGNYKVKPVKILYWRKIKDLF